MRRWNPPIGLFKECIIIFASPRYSVEEVNAAGKAMIAPFESHSDTDWEKWETSLNIVNNWRASHAYPLNTFTINLRTTAKLLSIDALVAQRIKRLPSIASKLRIHPKMKLSQMQDLGGCRAIVPDVGNVRDIVRYYEKVSSIKHVRQPSDDYIHTPKKSGYRGVHLIYRYLSDKKNKASYNGLKIEMQIRTRYQHAWATAVETVGMFSGQALKSSLGNSDWQRFFSLMGSAIALREKSALIPFTPSNRRDLMKELRDYAVELKVVDRLREYGKALHALTSAGSDSHFYLLKLDATKGTLDVSGFPARDVVKAEQQYADAESAAKDTGQDVVLVSVDSINALGKAYPNYFADTRLFVELLEQALAGRSRGIRIPDAKISIRQTAFSFPPYP